MARESFSLPGTAPDLHARLRTYARFIVRHRTAVLLAMLLLTGFFAAGLTRLRLEVDPDRNLPQDHPAIQALNEIHARFGDKNLVVIGLLPHDGRPFTPAFLAKLDAITRRVGALPGAVPGLLQSIASPSVKSLRGTADGVEVGPLMPTVPATQAEADVLRARVLAEPSWIGTLVSRDGQGVAIFATFELTPETPAYEDLYAAVREAVASSDDGSFRWGLSGPVALSGAAGEHAARVLIYLPVALLLIGLVHYEAFRTLQAIFLPLLTALLAVIWALGAIGWAGVPLDPFNATTPILILAVAAGHAVQVLKRYYEELGRLGDSRAAVIESTAEVGAVMIAAGAIASLSFFSLATFGIATMRTFGLFTGFGILSALAIELTVIPALRVILTPGEREGRRAREEHRRIDAVLGRLAATISGGGAVTVLMIAAALAAICVGFASQVRVDTSFKRFFSSDAPARREDDLLNAHFAGTSTLLVLIEGSSENAILRPESLAAMDRIGKRLEGLPGVGKALSVVAPIERLHAALGADRGTSGLPDTERLAAQYALLYSLSGGDDLASWMTEDGRSAKLVVLLRDDSTRFGEERIADLRGVLDAELPSGYRYRIAGTLASNGALTEVLVHGKLWNMAQIAAITFAVSTLLFGSWLAGLLVVVPLAAAVLLNFAVLGALSRPLDVATAIVSAMAVGIGADYAIYFLFRLRDEHARLGGDLAAALRETYLTSGKAIVFVSTAIAVGYATLCLSDFALHRRLGGLVALAMLSSSAAALTILPALLWQVGLPRRWARGVAAPAPQPVGARDGS